MILSEKLGINEGTGGFSFFDPMPLDISKLKNVRPSAGKVRAQCPACAEQGHDTKGEHLMIFSDGRFGCAVCSGDHQHRARIWALAGDGIPSPANRGVVPVVLRKRCWLGSMPTMPAKLRKLEIPNSRTFRTPHSDPSHRKKDYYIYRKGVGLPHPKCPAHPTATQPNHHD